MPDAKPQQSRRLWLAAGAGLVGSTLGLGIGRLGAPMLQTSPAWLGPLIAVATLAVGVVAVLLVPVVSRRLKTWVAPRQPHRPGQHDGRQ